MQVIVDGESVELAPGMTVRHALLARYGSIPEGVVVFDRWHNQIGLDGGLNDATVLTTEEMEPNHAD